MRKELDKTARQTFEKVDGGLYYLGLIITGAIIGLIVGLIIAFKTGTGMGLPPKSGDLAALIICPVIGIAAALYFRRTFGVVGRILGGIFGGTSIGLD